MTEISVYSIPFLPSTKKIGLVHKNKTNHMKYFNVISYIHTNLYINKSIL